MSQIPAADGFQRFEVKPPILESGKKSTIPARTDIAFVEVQAVAAGWRNNLHAHTGLDGVWFVVSGRARFYTTDDEVVAELDPGEGLVVPRGTPYWFEAASDENLVILHTAAKAQNEINKRVNYTERVRTAPVVLRS